jgi:OOP family OmpA-OmpF porin
VQAPRRPRPEEVANWFAMNGEDSQAAQEWAVALRKPLEMSLEDLRHRPRRAAELLAPVMDAALVENRRHRVAHLREEWWKWMAVMINPSLWPLALKALWEGEPVWDYMERRAGWYQVVEAVLVGSGAIGLLGRVEAPMRRRPEKEKPLHELLLVPVEQPEPVFDEEDDRTPMVDEADGTRVMVLMGVYCRLAVRVCGHPPEKLRPSLQVLCQEADRMLERASTDQASRAAMIERLLQRALMKNSPASSPWTRQSAIVLGIIGSLILLAVVTYYGKQERIWQDAVRALSEEPGLQIVGESSSWGRREIRGLRDPLARDPEEVLTNLGIDLGDVVLKFKGYLSAEEPFLLRHVKNGPREILATLPDNLEPTSKPVAKPAPLPAAPRRVAPVKITSDPSSDPPDSSLSAVESIVIAFKPGTDQLAGGIPEKLTALAKQVRQLQELSSSNGQVLHISLQVRESNATTSEGLWQVRQLAVRDALTKAGVAPQTIDPTLEMPPTMRAPMGNAPDSLSLRLTFESPTARP